MDKPVSQAKNKNYLGIADIDYEIIGEPERAKEVLASFSNDYVYALDFETTELTPEEGIVRITTVWNESVAYVFDHMFCGSFESLCKHFIGPTYIVMNAGFELKWFDAFCYGEVECWDVNIMRRSVMGGGYPNSLADLCKFDLKIDLDKTFQVGGWDDPRLTDHQYRYAAYDGYVTWELFRIWNDRMDDDHWNGFHVVNDCWRGNIEMERTGLRLDSAYHMSVIKRWMLKRDTAMRYVRKYTDEETLANIASNKQIGEFLKVTLDEQSIAHWPVTGKLKQLKITRATLTTAANRAPYPLNRWMAAVVIVRFHNKYLSTYGIDLVNMQNRLGKVRYRLNVAQAITGRYSSSAINVQNLPRAPYVRRSFLPPRKVDRLVLADYSGIEVRVAAEISGDETLKQDCIYGNVHGTGAALIQKIPEDDFLGVLEDKSHKLNARYRNWRQDAKVFTFRLLYGAGVGALANSLRSTDKIAHEAVTRWAERYPQAYNIRYTHFDQINHDGC